MDDLLRRLFGRTDRPRAAHPLDREASSTGDVSPRPAGEGSASIAPPIMSRVLAIIHNPTALSGKPVQVAYGWNDPDRLAAQYLKDVREASYGIVNYEIVDRIEVTDPVRGRNIAKKFFNTRTDPPPPPDVKVRRGAKCNDADGPPCHPQGGGGDDCVDTSCGFITVEVANFFGPVTCTVSAQGGGVLGTVNLPDNSKLETDLYFGVTGNWVKASCDGPSGTSETGSFDWPN